MQHQRPWFRTSKNAWFVQIDGKQVLLVKGKKNREAAEVRFHEIMLERARRQPVPADPRKILTREICDRFLVFAEQGIDSRTFEFYRKYLQSFCDQHGTLRAADLRPFHLTAWLDAHPGWKASRCHATIAVKRCFKWATEEGVCERNPFLGVRKPPVRRRERILTPSEKAEILDTIRDEPFRQFVFALFETG